MTARYFTLLLALLAAVPAFAQRPTGTMQQMMVGTLKGQVVDAATGDGLPTASIAVYTVRDSSLFTGAITDMSGMFMIEQLRPGRYYVRVSLVGYATQVLGDVTITREEPIKDFGRLQLSEDATMLDEVEVTADREAVEFAIDRTVYNVSEMPIAATGSTSQLLENVPSVEVDVDGNVSLRGSQNVVIYINGKPSPVQGDFLASYLQQLPANMIERVEVIPNPSAKYDPEGMAGILNIVMKQDAEIGLGGSVTAGFDTQGSYNAGGNLNFQKGKLSVFSNYGLRNRTRSGDSFNFRQDLRPNPAFPIINSFDTGDRGGLGHNLSTTLDYRLTDKNTLSLSVIGSIRNGENDGSVRYEYYDAQGNLLFDAFDRMAIDNSDGWSTDFRTSFQRVIQAGSHEFSAEARYNMGANEGLSTYEQTRDQYGVAPLREENLRTDDDQEVTLQADYVRPLGENGKLEVGVKSELEWNDSRSLDQDFDFGANQFEATFDQDFDFNQQVHAAYLILGNSFGNFSAQVGLRAEQAMTDFTLLTDGTPFSSTYYTETLGCADNGGTLDCAFENDYFSLYPSAFLTYKPDIAKQFKVSYSKRVERPRSRQLNPFAQQSDPLNLFVGNPAVKPEYTHSFEIGYQQFTEIGSFSFTPYYRHTTDVVRRLQETDQATGVSTVTFRNLDTRDSWGIESILGLRFGRVLSGFLSFNGFREVTDNSTTDPNGDVGSDAFGWNVRANASWQVTPTTAVQLFGFYNAPRDVEQGRIESMTFFNLGVRQQVLDGRGALSLSVRDPFDQQGFRFSTANEFLARESERTWGGRSVGLSFTYNFGEMSRRNRRMDRGEGETEGMEEGGIQ